MDRLRSSKLVLTDDVVDVWLVSVDMMGDELEAFSTVLSDDERERAAKFHFEIDRRRFTACRGLLRLLLASYSNVEAGKLRFGYGERGKPFIPDSDLKFNTAHSEGLAIFAVSKGRELGVDVEKIRPIRDIPSIVARFFSEHEQQQFAGVNESDQLTAFFSGWTRKEACIKAWGEGLFAGLKSFDVLLLPSQPAMLVAMDGSTEKAGQWKLEELDVGSGVAGALCVAGNGWRVNWRTRQLSRQ